MKNLYFVVDKMGYTFYYHSEMAVDDAIKHWSKVGNGLYSLHVLKDKNAWKWDVVFEKEKLEPPRSY